MNSIHRFRLGYLFDSLKGNPKDFEIFAYVSQIAASIGNITVKSDAFNDDYLFANGLSTAKIHISDIRDANGLPVPDNTYLNIFPWRNCSVSNEIIDHRPAGAVFPNPCGTIGRGGVCGGARSDGKWITYRVIDGHIDATYRDEGAAPRVGNITTKSIDVYQASQNWYYDGNTPYLRAGYINLVYTSSGAVTPTPGTVKIDNKPHTMAVTVSGITDAAGRPVPDGTPIMMRGGGYPVA